MRIVVSPLKKSKNCNYFKSPLALLAEKKPCPSSAKSNKARLFAEKIRQIIGLFDGFLYFCKNILVTVMWLHQRKDWWQFHYDSGQLLSKLSSVRSQQGRLLGQMEALGFEVRDSAQLDALTMSVIKSSEIEGERLNPDQVRSSIARRLGLAQAGLPEPSRYIDGVVEMMMDATHNFDNPLTDERLFGWHNVLFPTGRSGLYKIEVEQYRTGEMQVVSGPMGHEKVHFQAPGPERVKTEMDRLISWINKDKTTEPLLKSAIAHLWFVTIHPFDDGNGRIARAISDMLLAQSDHSPQRYYSMSAAICANRKRYYDILQETQLGDGDITPWLLWFLDCLSQALETSSQSVGKALNKADFWNRHKEYKINLRQAKIINLLLDGFDGQMTTGRWSRICHCSRDTALNDANSLVEMGILQLGSSGGRSTHYLLSNP